MIFQIVFRFSVLICIKNKVIGACAGDITVIMQRKLCCGKKIQIEIKTV